MRGGLVGVIGFEPTVLSSRTTRATRLRYTPQNKESYKGKTGNLSSGLKLARGGINRQGIQYGA